MMKATKNYLFAISNGYSVLELPYISRESEPKLSMVIILPKDTQGLGDLEKSITSEELNSVLKSMNSTNVEAVIPKFKITDTFSLNETLKQLGMTQAFEDNADFSGITGKPGLKISKVVHKAFVSVNEEGTEAAAATAASINVTAIYNPNPPVQFHADHPFMFLIVDRTTNAILFMGRVNHPDVD
jgi:serpin B